MRRKPTIALAVFLSMFGLQATALCVAATTLPSYDRIRVLQTPRSVSDAELTDQDGEPFRLSQFEGRITFVFFGFTNCPDVCPMTMRKFQQLNDSGAIDSEKVAFVLVSVDGERDSPEVLKAYLKKFSPDFVGLTGAPTVVKAIAKEFSASFYKGNSSTDGESYTMMHSPQAFLLDTDGLLRAELYSPTIDAMAGLTNALLKEAESEMN